MPIIVERNEHSNLLQAERCPSPEFQRSAPKRAAPKKPLRESISFDEVVRIYYTLHVNDMSDEEFFNTFYQRDDFYAMKVDIVRTVTKVTKGMYEGDDEIQCSRGLECRTQSGAQERKENKLRSRNKVFLEQKRQEDCGICDPEALRSVYVSETKQCEQSARDLAKADEAEAKKIQAKSDPAAYR
mmetsp:Transcript_16377/g.37619  ORF Transcript_16377/g.37619 Transcript_16377/m.37619 type:complete len:185 (-) Transcript_16377:234-788(-)